MPRKKTKSLARVLTPDIRFQNVMVTKLINKVMRDGKKRLAERLVYSAFDIIAVKTKKEAIEVFDQALKNVAPNVQVKSRRIGGANYQVPVEVKGDRRIHLALTWILDAAHKKSGQSFDKLLANEILDAYNSQGEAIKKREDTHRMAEANKAFAHFARF
jgi:small subunit ribosomal protein S7